MTAKIVAVSKSGTYTFSKPNQGSIRLLAGLGVEGDVHMGETVKHRSSVAKNPDQPNLRQVHLIHAELHDELNTSGFQVSAGQMGENITTRGIDILGLPVGTRLHLGKKVVIEITGLRNPCEQLDTFQDGLLKACVSKDADGNIIRKAGVMAIVLVTGEVFPGDAIQIEYPSQPFQPLQPV